MEDIQKDGTLDIADTQEPPKIQEKKVKKVKEAKKTPDITTDEKPVNPEEVIWSERPSLKSLIINGVKQTLITTIVILLLSSPAAYLGFWSFYIFLNVTLLVLTLLVAFLNIADARRLKYTLTSEYIEISKGEASRRLELKDISGHTVKNFLFTRKSGTLVFLSKKGKKNKLRMYLIPLPYKVAENVTSFANRI
ncbi:MAG: hypothetical protein LBT30_07785 [Clostridiales bacterium]|nr:hypothetical protein [Clostridiales bacterium]